MKVGIVTPHDYFHHGGVQEHVKAQAKVLKDRGHDVVVISPRVKKTAPEKIPEGIILLGQATKMNNPMSTGSEIGFTVDSKEIEEMFSHHNFDIMHFHEPWVPVLSRQILARSPAVNIATFHAKLPENTVNKSIEMVSLPYTRSSLKYIDAITAVSTAGAQFIKSVSKKKIRIIPNGIDLKLYSPEITKQSKNVSKAKKTILYIGRLEKRKGVMQLLKAFAQIANNKTELVIVGEGPKKTSLQNYVKTWAIPNVKFLGFVSEEEKKKLLKSADVFCSPALYGESFGIVLVEAMAMGVPIIAGDNPGYKCVLKGPARLGLVDPKDTLEFANKLQIFTEESDLGVLLSEWGKKDVRQYDYELIVDEYEKLYQELV